MSVIVDGERVHVQKRLLPKETYALFCEEFSNVKIGLSKFQELKEKNIILPSAKGVHKVCVCTHHQNVKLMLESSGLLKNDPLNLVKDSENLSFKSYLGLLVCKDPKPDCFENNCENCFNKDNSADKDNLLEYFTNLELDTIKFYQWVTVDRSELVQQEMDIETFIGLLFKKLHLLKTHHFVAKEQTSFYRNSIENVGDDEVIVAGDFSENYCFIQQNEAQSHYFNR